MVSTQDSRLRSGLRRGLSDVLVHALVFLGFFWAVVLAGTVLPDVVYWSPWLYVLGLYAYKLYEIDRPSLELSPPPSIGTFGLWWVIVFPLVVFVGNLVGLAALGAALRQPVLRGLPLIATIAAEWNWASASGLSALVVYTSLLCVIVGLVGLFGRALAIIVAPGTVDG